MSVNFIKQNPAQNPHRSGGGETRQIDVDTASGRWWHIKMVESNFGRERALAIVILGGNIVEWTWGVKETAARETIKRYCGALTDFVRVGLCVFFLLYFG